jgi:hypothetical protein
VSRKTASTEVANRGGSSTAAGNNRRAENVEFTVRGAHIDRRWKRRSGRGRILGGRLTFLPPGADPRLPNPRGRRRLKIRAGKADTFAIIGFPGTDPRAMMRRAVLFVGLLSSLSGCTQIALQKDTVRTTSTLAELQYRQVLDNVARFHDNPDTVPSFAVPSAGIVSVLDTARAGVSPTWAPTLPFSLQGGGALPILTLLFPFTASRAVTENWSLTPITDADNLRRLRCAYRLLVLGEATPNYQFCVKQMKEFFAGEEADLEDRFPPRGWYGVGGKKDVPKGACYVGCHCKTYVWVLPGGMNDLAVFTMASLDLATGKMRTPQETEVRKYKGEPKPENLIETTVTRTRDDEAALEDIRKGRTRPLERSRITRSAPFNPGLFMLPRP